MDSKITELTDKLYREGVEKGEQQARQILADAKAKAEQILADAKKQAEKISVDAQANAAELKRTVASEIKLSGQQALAGVKQQILDVVMTKAVDEGLTKTLDDPLVLKDLVSLMVQNWKAAAGQELALEVLLPEIKRQEVEKALSGTLQKQFSNTVTIAFSRAFASGFRIGPADGSYRVSLTDQDFIEFFKGFLRPRARTYLFGE
jgi:V/A-type H+-transporting ATPase subunit E